MLALKSPVFNYCHRKICAVLRHFDTAPKAIRLENLRFYMLLNLAHTQAWAAHLFWGLFFCQLRIWMLAAVQPVFIGLYVVSIWLNRYGRHMLSMYLSIGALVVHMVLAARLLGPGAGFQYFLPVAAMFPFLLQGGNNTGKGLLLVFAASGFLVVELLIPRLAPLYLLREADVHFFAVTNILFVFACFAMLAIYLSVSVARSQRIVSMAARRQRDAAYAVTVKQLHLEHRKREEAIHAGYQQELERGRQNREQETETIITRLKQAIVITDEQWAGFRMTFEGAFPGFLSRLREKLPELSPAETRFIVLTKLGMDAKEMAVMLGVGHATIRKYRHRLRNKLNLPADQTIEDIVFNI